MLGDQRRYSIDKQDYLSSGWHWFNDEQPEPTEVFIPGIDQSDVDKSTEEWLDSFESQTQYKQWFCGHYQTEKKIDRLQFLFESIISFDVP